MTSRVFVSPPLAYMHQFLSTPDLNAKFDFFSNTITLVRLKGYEIPRVMNWMKNPSVFEKGGAEARAAREDKADLVHEVTHFIDATCTSWGLEYNARKTLATQKIFQRDEYVENQVQVFMLNTAEVSAHGQFTKIRKPGAILTDCTLHHRAVEDDSFGPLIIVEYHQDGNPVLEVPLSMLSVLEANAYANETLSKILDAEAITSDAEKTEVLAAIVAKYYSCMGQPTRCEYTVLLHLANIHFPRMELKSRLRMFSAIVHLALNMDASQMTWFAQSVASTFRSSAEAASTIFDMQRGTSRAVVVLKTLLCMYDYLAYIDEVERDEILNQLSTDCYGALEQLLSKMGLLENNMLLALELDIHLNTVESGGFLHDKVIVPTSVRQNRSLVERRSCAEAFTELWLPDAIMDDGKQRLQFLKRIDVDVLKVSAVQTLPFSLLVAKMHKQKMAKFFVSMKGSPPVQT